MKASIKSYLKTLFHMALAGFITNIAYIGCDAIIRAVVNDLSEKMTLTRSLLYMLAMLGLQILYCFILIAFRYGNSGEGIRRLTEDCRTEPYAGLLPDMKKLIRKEQSVLFTALGIIVLSTIQWFIPMGLLGGITNLFIGITGVSVFIPDLFVFLFLKEITPSAVGLIHMFCMNGMLIGFFLFCAIYLFMLSRKRKKWCDDWKVIYCAE